MSAGSAVFSQQQFYAVASAPEEPACVDIAEQLKTAGTARSPRATLYRNGPQPGLRTALLLDFGGRLPGQGPLAGRFGLWLTEHDNRTISCFGCERPLAGRGIGGRVMHNLPVLEPGGHWLRQFAADLASTRGGPPRGNAGASAGVASLFEQRTRVEHATLSAALTAFAAELDADVLAVVRAGGTPSIATYNHYWTGSDRQRRNRLQAAKTHPRFSGLLCDDWRLRRAVDTGLPLTQALAEHFHVRTATIQRTRQLAPECVPDAALPSALQALDALPNTAMPVSSGDWSVFLGLHAGLMALAQTIGADLGVLVRPFASGWQEGLQALERKLSAPLDIDAMFEMMHCAYVYGVRPAVQTGLTERGSKRIMPIEAPASFFPLWFGRYGLQRLAQMAGEWRDAHGRFSIERLGINDRLGAAASLTWPALLPTQVSHDGLRVIELTSRHALELEGRRLEHCVASYAVKCLMADSSLFSIRDQHGQPLSTFEVRVPVAGGAQLLQHHAHSHAEPDAKLDAVAQRFVAQVLPRLPRETLDAARKGRRALGERVRGTLGKPNELDKALTPSELEKLAGLIAFAHPAEARREGIFAFLQAQVRPVAQEQLAA